jgi:cell division protein FtsA
MDTRIGYPNEHLAGDSDSETTSPMYATAVGLVLTNLNKKNRTHASARPKEIDEDLDFTSSDQENEEVSAETEVQDSVNQRGFFDKWADKFKEFLDNAE